jgi:hypothetical protein
MGQAAIDEDLSLKQRQYVDMEDGYQPGAILLSQWGWEQTQSDFYLITERSGNWVKFVPLRGELVSGGGAGMTGTKMPTSILKDRSDEDLGWPWNYDQDTKEIRRKLKGGGGSRRFLTVKYGSCSIWNGQPAYVSWYN